RPPAGRACTGCSCCKSGCPHPTVTRTWSCRLRLPTQAATHSVRPARRLPALLASLLLRFGCGLWSRGDRGRACQLGVEQDQQRFVVRELHAVGLRGVAPALRDEPLLVRCAGVETALARDHPSHTHRGDARNPRLDRGKITPRPWLGHCSAID